ncbi:MAG TPA: hypothetical protein VJS37_09490, partial [Terriglobales bacterium]|nr:hypothetical protein [Terriglobales bacterium]
MFLKSSHIGSSGSSGVSRRGLLKAAACAAGTVPALSAGRVLALAAQSPPPAKPFRFEEVTVAGLQEKMKSGSLSASALTKAYLARIEELDKSRVNSLIEVNPEARAIAASLDTESKAKG